MSTPDDPAPDTETRPDPDRFAATTPETEPAPAGGARAGADFCSLTPGGTCGRYRIVERLGEGGMGAVFRAEDTELRQTVALKFLGRQFVDSKSALDQMRNEVRLARRVTHPNVCRVHDLVQQGDEHFISMEYVDGETLDGLQRRVGRFSPDKAAQIARQLVAGLHAAHEQGVLHRDLKPQNVMIDGRGDVRITDFGIAGLASAQGGTEDAPSGTPAYMAPELFTGASATAQSDLFSLGVVLYELYTGRRLFGASTMTDLLRLHRRPVEPPSALAPGLDPELERLILDCLQRDPARRPRSTLEVLSRLPGSDLLADVLASGKTPSPELIAATSTRHRHCRAGVAVLVALFIVGLAALFVLEPGVKLIAGAGLQRRKSAVVLADAAEQHIVQLYHGMGLTDELPFRAYGFDIDQQFLDAVAADVATSVESVREDAWSMLEQGPTYAIDFWYRASPEPLIADHLSGVVDWADPPPVQPGAIRMRLDPTGALRELERVPPEIAAVPGVPAPGVVPSVDDAVLRAVVSKVAGLEDIELGVESPTVVPVVFADHRFAWCGPPDGSGNRMRVEAATLRGELVALKVFEERWREVASYEPERERRGGSALAATVKFVSLIGAVVLAWSTLRAKRGDRVGAFRFGVAIFLLVFAVTMCTGTHTTDLLGEGRLLLNGLARALLVAVQYWLFYIALEPHVRRIWPEILIAWSRLLAGRVTDSQVAYSVLVGNVLGVFGALALYLGHMSHTWVGDPPAIPFVSTARTLEMLHGPLSTLGSALEIVAYNAGFGMSFLLALVILKFLLRSQKAAVLVWGVIQTAIWVQMAREPTVFHWVFYGALSAACLLVVVRVGVLALMFGIFTFQFLAVFPLRTDLDHWLGGPTLFAVAVTTGIVAFSVWGAVRDTSVTRAVARQVA